MSLIPILLGIGVGVLNIMLNEAVQVAAKNPNTTTFLDSIFSMKFLYAFIIGTVAITIMFTFYYNATKYNLSQAILLMGATSIVLGTLYGVIWRKLPITEVEIAVLITIVLLYVFKYLKSLNIV